MRKRMMFLDKLHVKESVRFMLNFDEGMIRVSIETEHCVVNVVQIRVSYENYCRCNCNIL